MKIAHHPAVFGIAAAGALVLAACGTDNNSDAGGPSPANTAGISCASGSLTAAGSTAQQNAISQWNKAYLTKCSDANVNYQGVGSGAGVQQFAQNTVDFAGSDFALSSADQPGANARCGSGNSAIDLPMVPGPIAIGYNIPGVGQGLNLSAANLAKIFTGKITNWNDPAIAADNPGITLPKLGIQTFHRSDGSGTSYNFANYLANEAKADFGFDANKNWPAPGGQGSKGTQGIAQGVQSTQGGVGYMELSFAQNSHINYAKVGNTAGKFVELTTDNVKNFLAKASVVGTGNDLKLALDYADTDANAYPNLLVTYEIVCQSGNSVGKLKLLKSYLGYAASPDGQAVLQGQGYVPLPENLRTKVADAVSSIK